MKGALSKRMKSEPREPERRKKRKQNIYDAGRRKINSYILARTSSAAASHCSSHDYSGRVAARDVCLITSIESAMITKILCRAASADRKPRKSRADGASAGIKQTQRRARSADGAGGREAEDLGINSHLETVRANK